MAANTVAIYFLNLKIYPDFNIFHKKMATDHNLRHHFLLFSEFLFIRGVWSFCRIRTVLSSRVLLLCGEAGCTWPYGLNGLQNRS